MGRLLVSGVAANANFKWDTLFDEPFGDSVHLRLRAQTIVSDHGGSLALNETEDGLATTTPDTIRSSHATPSNFFPFAPRELLPRLNDLCLNQGGAPSTGVLDDTT